MSDRKLRVLKGQDVFLKEDGRIRRMMFDVPDENTVLADKSVDFRSFIAGIKAMQTICDMRGPDVLPPIRFVGDVDANESLDHS